jgi:hypothetical protein
VYEPKIMLANRIFMSEPESGDTVKFEKNTLAVAKIFHTYGIILNLYSV